MSGGQVVSEVPHRAPGLGNLSHASLTGSHAAFMASHQKGRMILDSWTIDGLLQPLQVETQWQNSKLNSIS